MNGNSNRQVFIGLSLTFALTYRGAHAASAEQVVASNSCADALTANGSKDSMALPIYMDDIYYGDGSGPGGANFAVRAAARMLQRLGCRVDYLPVGTGSVQCGSGKFRNICRLDSDAGYFVVVKDMVDTGHVIFNRYD